MIHNTAATQLKQAWSELHVAHRMAIGLLIASGVLHIPMQLFSSLAWEDPISFRKPILFGISTGLTLWSCLWVSRRLQGNSTENVRALVLDRILSIALLLEVLLISIQPWRQTRSHFAVGGSINAAIEGLMLLLIIIATCLIIVLAVRCFVPGALQSLTPAMRRAIRSGMILLVVSCGLGFLITWIGKTSMLAGGHPEIWGAAGVLKFPHGAALHAIQFLVILAWAARFKLDAAAEQCVAWAARTHWLWLAFALQQTFRGRDRFEFDLVSAVFLVATLAAAVLSVVYFYYARTSSRDPERTAELPH